jgi:hypothetical protein
MHAHLPTLCIECHLTLIDLAECDPRPYLVRWCQLNRTLAFACRRGPDASITHWELHLVPTDDEHRLFAERLYELCASGQCATRGLD